MRSVGRRGRSVGWLAGTPEQPLCVRSRTAHTPVMCVQLVYDYVIVVRHDDGSVVVTNDTVSVAHLSRAFSCRGMPPLANVLASVSRPTIVIVAAVARLCRLFRFVTPRVARASRLPAVDSHGGLDVVVAPSGATPSSCNGKPCCCLSPCVSL